MVIYYVISLGILPLGYFCHRFKESQAKKLFLVSCFSILSIFMAIRAETVGTDIHIYYNKFQDLVHANTFQEVINTVDNAPVYSLLSKLVSLFGGYRLWLILMTFMILGSVAIYIYHFSNNVVISTYCFITLFYYLHAYNISRQFLAIAFVLLSLCCRKTKHPLLSLAFFLLALGVHSTALCTLPLILMNQEKTSNRKFIFFLIIESVIIFFVTVMFSPIVQLFCAIFPRYSFYLQHGKYNVNNTSSGAAIFLALFYFFIVLLAILLQSGKVRFAVSLGQERSAFRFLIIVVMAGSMMGLLGGNNLLINRILHFYQIHSICLLPNTMRLLSKNRFYYLIYYGILLILLIPFTICLQKNFGNVVPYATMWQSL